MASDFATEFAADAFPDLLTEFGEAITLRSESGADTSATGVFQESMPRESEERGKSVRRMADVKLSSGATVTVRYRIQRGSAWWDVVSVSDEPGYKMVRVQRVEDEIRSGQTGRII